MTTKLYDILTDSNLTQSQAAQAVLELLNDNSSELADLRRLHQVLRDSEAMCKHPDVLRAAKYFISADISRASTESWLSALVDQ